jgi:outer membrane receptor protein involved in Fe transport
VDDPTGARLLRATNAELVTLTGFDFDVEREISHRLTAFGSARYLLGDDLDIALTDGTFLAQPLFGISPLEGRIGLRLHDMWGGEKWGSEISARMVDGQDRIAGLRLGSNSIQSLGPLEEATPGFTVWNVRGYYNYSRNLHMVAGIENLFDRTYQEHLDLRIPADTRPDSTFDATRVLAPGSTLYVGFEWIR